MSHYVTAHNANGEAIFSNKIPKERKDLKTPMGGMSFLYTTYKAPTNVSTEEDIDQYRIDEEQGIGQKICPENGTAVGIITLAAGAESPMHRTMTLDVVYILEGTVELILDSGDQRTLKSGDSIIQRAGMHKWINHGSSEVKMLGFAQAIQEPLNVGGKELKTEFVMPQ